MPKGANPSRANLHHVSRSAATLPSTQARLILFDAEEERILEWTELTNIEP